MPVLIGAHRHSVLEASGEGGRHRPREKACLCREAKVREGCGEEERKEEEPRAASTRETQSQVEAWGVSKGDSTDEDDENDDEDDGDDSEGMAARLDRILQDLP